MFEVVPINRISRMVEKGEMEFLDINVDFCFSRSLQALHETLGDTIHVFPTD